MSFLWVEGDYARYYCCAETGSKDEACGVIGG